MESLSVLFLVYDRTAVPSGPPSGGPGGQITLPDQLPITKNIVWLNTVMYAVDNVMYI